MIIIAHATWAFKNESRDWCIKDASCSVSFGALSDFSVILPYFYIYHIPQIVSTDFGLVVSFNGQYDVDIGLPIAYKDKTCGLCGNFNDDTSDDFMDPNGQLVRYCPRNLS